MGSDSPLPSSKKGGKNNMKNNEGKNIYSSFDSVFTQDLEKCKRLKSADLCPSKRKIELQCKDEKPKEAHDFSPKPSGSSSTNSNSDNSHNQSQWASFNSALSPASNKLNSQKSENLCTPKAKTALQHNDEKIQGFYHQTLKIVFKVETVLTTIIKSSLCLLNQFSLKPQEIICLKKVRS